MTIALLEKEDRNKSQDGSGVKRMLVWSDEQQEKTGADQASREDALWSKPKVSKRRYKTGFVKRMFPLCRSGLKARLCCCCFQ